VVQRGRHLRAHRRQGRRPPRSRRDGGAGARARALGAAGRGDRAPLHQPAAPRPARRGSRPRAALELDAGERAHFGPEVGAGSTWRARSPP
jgi:hypothetical protein